MTIHEHQAIPIPQVEPRAAIPAQNLRIPGPTTVPPEILAEMSRPMGLPLENNLTSPKLCGTLRIELSSKAADNRVVVRRTLLRRSNLHYKGP